jgi:hypothetical protein
MPLFERMGQAALIGPERHGGTGSARRRSKGMVKDGPQLRGSARLSEERRNGRPSGLLFIFLPSMLLPIVGMHLIPIDAERLAFDRDAYKPEAPASGNFPTTDLRPSRQDGHGVVE